MDSGNAILITNSNEKQRFHRLSIGAGGDFDEKWLQERIFEDISIIKVSNPDYDKIKLIPLCREFSMHDSIRNVYLDILAITETGKLILIECKLWKNPQARREVLAQIIEYATLMKSLTYSDLTVKLKKHIHSGDKDPIAFLFEKNGIEVDEALLIDRVSQSLANGSFQLVIAGDGIRSDLINLIRTSNFTGILADLSLLEVAVYKNEDNDILMLPSVPARTDVETKTVLLQSDGTPAIIEEEQEVVSESRMPSSINEKIKQKNRLFWDKFIENIKFDHPEQEKPRRGGNNWVKIPFPEPFEWVTAYRSKDKIGVFCSVNLDKNAAEVKTFFEEYEDQLKDEIGQSLRYEFITDKKDWGNGFFISINTVFDTLDDSTINDQLAWEIRTLNAYVNTLRPLCRKFQELH